MFQEILGGIQWWTKAIVFLFGATVFGTIAFFIARNWLRKMLVLVDQGQALIIIKRGAEPEVTFTGGIVFPVLNKAEFMDLSVRTVDIDRRGKEGLICRDNIRADIRVTFFVRVNKTKADVIQVAQNIGCARASSPATLETLFSAKFSEALKTVGKQMDFEDLYTQREKFRDAIIEVIGRHLNGYYLEDAAIDHLEQTPVNHLDPQNILDAQGIKKITELTAQQHIRTNEWENTRKKQITRQDVEAAEMIFDLERQKADAEARKEREIATVRAREKAETEKVEAEERLRSETARIKVDEDLEIQEQNKSREVEVAEKNRQRVIAVETERVERERALEQVAREREVELQKIAKERDLEEQRKNIQDVIRERVAVERTVAEEEERIKSVRVLEEARRLKEATVIGAQAEAEEAAAKDVRAAQAAEEVARLHAKELVTLAQAAAEEAAAKDVRAAQVAEEVARLHAKKIVTLAEAEQLAAEKAAVAKIRLAEGVQAESAAQGLAEAKVQEAKAEAFEKQGMAEVRVQDAQAPAREKLGLAEVTVMRERVRTEADAIELKLVGESKGLAEKAKAMAALDAASRQHEEYRLRLENERAIALEELKTRMGVAEFQARALAEAFKSAKIDIIGGDGAFVDKILNAVTLGKSFDGVVSRSRAGQALAGDYLEGRRSLPEDLVEVLSNPSMSSADVQNLTVSGALGMMMAGADGSQRFSPQQLLQAARALGIGGAPGAGRSEGDPPKG